MADRSFPLQLFLGTGNPHKVAEFRLLAPSTVTVDPAFSENVPAPPIAETGTTFFQNADIKARTACTMLGLRDSGIVFSDDSGLVVPALGGAPGLLSARYAGETATDLENRELLLRNMKGIPKNERKATFVCVLVAYDLRTGSLLAASRGEVPGHIANGLMGDGGFGYDPVFVPEGFRVSFGIMAPEEKNRISHRTRAFERLCRALAEAG